MFSPSSGVKAKCRLCGGEAPADQFKLHYGLRVMVCPNCYNGGFQKKEEKKTEPIKPVGWDKEDEYLEKHYQLKKVSEPKLQFRKIPGSNLLMLTCRSCNYNFKYDPDRRHPSTCPYCNEKLPEFKTFNF